MGDEAGSAVRLVPEQRAPQLPAVEAVDEQRLHPLFAQLLQEGAAESGQGGPAREILLRGDSSGLVDDDDQLVEVEDALARETHGGGRRKRQLDAIACADLRLGF